MPDSPEQVVAALQGARAEGPAVPAPRAPEPPHFDLVLRGYDRVQVDRHVAALAEENAALRRELEELREAPAEPAPAAADAAPPSVHGYAADTPAEDSFGFHAEKLLRFAEREATEMRTRATRDAEAVEAAARRSAEETLQAAEREAAEVRGRAEQEAQRRASEAEERAGRLRQEAAELRSRAEQEAADLRSRAEAEARRLTSEATQEADRIEQLHAVTRAQLRHLIGQLSAGLGEAAPEADREQEPASNP